jgi:putative membrane protein
MLTFDLILATIVYSLIGFVLLAIAYVVLDRITPGDATKKIFEEGNVAVAVFLGSVIIALGFIIGSVVGG